MKSFFEIASNMHPDDFKPQDIMFPRFRGSAPPKSDFTTLVFDPNFFSVFSRYHEGEGDPLLKVLMRIGDKQGFNPINVKVSQEEIQRIKKIAGRIIGKSHDDDEKRTAIAVLEEIRPYLSK